MDLIANVSIPEIIVFFTNITMSTIIIESYLFKFMLNFSSICAFISASVISVWFNPIYSLLSLILVFCFSVVYLSFLKVKFLSLIYILVYVGAIVILFLFMIMLLSLETPFYNLFLTRSLYLNVLVFIKFSIFSLLIDD